VGHQPAHSFSSGSHVGGCSWPTAGLPLALSPFEPACSYPKVIAIVYACFISRKTVLPMEKHNKSVLTPKNIKPFPEIL
jgi:hypothetical protein